MKIHETLSKIQAELKAPKGQYNSFGKYNYRSCEDIVEAVKPILASFNGSLVLSDSVHCAGDRVYIEATATIYVGEESISCTGYAREAATKKGMDDSQITGAASSYARKYALNGLLAIDDNKDADTDEHTEQNKPRTPEPENDKKWYNAFEDHREWMIGQIQSGKTPDQIIQKLSETYKISKKVRASIKELDK